MRTIIAGSRHIIDMRELHNALANCDWKITRVVSGNARGADTLGEKWAEENNIPLEKYPANWGRYPRLAGHIRNSEMAENADALIALWDGISNGTGHMIDTARRKKLKVLVHLV